jgi:hypothetical protein
MPSCESIASLATASDYFAVIFWVFSNLNGELRVDKTYNIKVDVVAFLCIPGR